MQCNHKWLTELKGINKRTSAATNTSSSSSSIGTATFVGFGLLNYRWVLSAGRFLQSAVASSTYNPQPGGPVIRTFQLLPPGVPHVWNDASEPQQQKVELWARNFREFCRKWRLPCHFWVLLHAVNLRLGTNGSTSPPKEAFGRVWTRKLGYQRPARLPLDHWSCLLQMLLNWIELMSVLLLLLWARIV